MDNQRLIKALSEKMCLLGAIQKDGGSEWVFKVRGQTNNVYEQSLCNEKYTCSCPDHQSKGTFCKHLLFLVARVAKQYELGGELAQRPKTTWKKNAYNACSTSWTRCLAHMIVAEPEITAVPPAAIDGVCAICFEDLSGCTDPLVECETTCQIGRAHV